MRIRRGEFERIRSVLAEANAEEPLTAREILALLEEHGVEFDSAHQVATVLGRHARRGDVEVIRDQPYRYRLGTNT
jgi:predicted Zn-ribbon and HTH transcriptional regulator